MLLHSALKISPPATVKSFFWRTLWIQPNSTPASTTSRTHFCCISYLHHHCTQWRRCTRACCHWLHCLYHHCSQWRRCTRARRHWLHCLHHHCSQWRCTRVRRHWLHCLQHHCTAMWNSLYVNTLDLLIALLVSNTSSNLNCCHLQCESKK